MDRDEAKLILQACRPNGQDDALPAFAEALALVEHDPELKAWWESQRAFDRAISAKLKEVAIPADLHATIMAGRKIEQMTPRFQLPLWLAAAAMVMLCLGLSLYFKGGSHSGVASSDVHLEQSAGPVSVANHDYEKGVFDYLDSDAMSLAMSSPDHDKVAAWLKQRNSPTGNIPGKMVSLPSAGCQTFAVHGHTVSLICFALADGGYAHLFIVDKSALNDPPGNSPEFHKNGEWYLATWSDDGHSYMLATEDGPAQLKQLL
jgi:hypothetical protein